MSEYVAPVREMAFALAYAGRLAEVTALPGFEEVDADMAEDLLEEAARFMHEVISPTNEVGDREGSKLEAGEVRTPNGFKEAYRELTQAGWHSVAMEAEHGGGGLPYLVSSAVTEMMASANMAMGLCPALGEGAIEALAEHGSEMLRTSFLPKLVRGEWSATMDLTEPQAGSDLGALRSVAEPQEDGSYLLRGGKIFITYGDHDMAENIVHLVLARLPDAPPGSHGISLFIVPKFLAGPGGELGERNDVEVVSIEHKLGIHASPTCVMAYGAKGGATAYLIGEPHHGLHYMFTMMNRERVFVGTQGLGIAERALQRAVEYAGERKQGRAPGDEIAPGEQSTIVLHPDVRRMLVSMKARIAAMRPLLYRAASAVDLSRHHPDKARRKAESNRLALLTPVVKAWCSDLGVEVASEAIQVHGGVGYVEETGAAQYLRDARIAPIYEGTNGIQSADLALRKLPLEGGKVVAAEFDEFAAMVDRVSNHAGLEDLGAQLGGALATLREATTDLLARLEAAPRSVAGAATPYLRLFGGVVGGILLADLAREGLVRDAETEASAERLTLARFYADDLLPRDLAFAASVTTGDRHLFDVRL